MSADQLQLTGLEAEAEAAPLPGQVDLFELLEGPCGQDHIEVRRTASTEAGA